MYEQVDIFINRVCQYREASGSPLVSFHMIQMTKSWSVTEVMKNLMSRHEPHDRIRCKIILAHGNILVVGLPVGFEIIISGSLLELENRPFILLESLVNTPPPEDAPSFF